LQCRAAGLGCRQRPTTLRPSVSFRSAPETPTATPGDRDRPTGSVASPRRSILATHNSFKSYFRPALASRPPLPPPPPPALSPDHSPDQRDHAELRPTSGSHDDLVAVSAQQHGVYRKQAVRDAARSVRMTPSMKRRQLAGASSSRSTNQIIKSTLFATNRQNET